MTLDRDLNHIDEFMALDLTDEETTALAQLLRDAIDGDRFPLSPRIRMLKGNEPYLTLA